MESQEEVNAKVGPGGVEVSARSLHINTIVTVAVFMLLAVLAYGGMTHMQDTREATKEITSAMREQTTALREQTSVQREYNCLQTLKDDSLKQSDFCKRMTR